MQTNLTYKQITKSSEDYQWLEELFNEAFPPSDRPYSFEQMIELSQSYEGGRFLAVYDGDDTVGLISYFVWDTSLYLLFVATNSKIRSKGYGSKIMADLAGMHENYQIFGFAETPIQGAENFAQADARKKFYERNGYFYSKYSYTHTDPEFGHTAMTVFANFDEAFIPQNILKVKELLVDILSEEELQILEHVASGSED